MLNFDQIADSLLAEIDTLMRKVETETNAGLEPEIDGKPNPRRIQLRAFPVSVGPGKRTIEIRHDGEGFGRPYLAEVSLQNAGGFYLSIKAQKFLEGVHLFPEPPPISPRTLAPLHALLRRQVWAGRNHDHRKLVERYGADMDGDMF